ncbi:MAG: alkyl hydroperoxide reductase subunit F [Candidatus Paceibacteria bacterium]|jgi:alkyl hydroperoxide reductase subunit F
MTYDLIIIGGGPAGAAGAVYAARKQLKTLIIAKEFGGQSVVSEKIFNWIGTPELSGSQLAEDLKNHVEYYKGEYLDILTGELVEKVDKVNAAGREDGLGQKSEEEFTVTTDTGKVHTSKAVLIASGSGRRKLSVPGAEEYDNKGIVYCASCDGPLFSGQDVVVVGGGNSGFETAAQLLAYAKSVTLLQRSSEYRADPITVKKVLSHPNMKGVLNASIKEVKGEAFVKEVVYTNDSGEEISLAVGGVFVEIGQIPNTALAEGLVELDDYNKITIDPWTQQTSLPGVWAAGDCANIRYHQNNIATGDAVKAIEDIYLYIHTK